MAKVTLQGVARRVGNSIGFVVPSKVAKEAGVVAGKSFRLTVEEDDMEILGFSSELYDGPFDRARENLWRDER